MHDHVVRQVVVRGAIDDPVTEMSRGELLLRRFQVDVLQVGHNALWRTTRDHDPHSGGPPDSRACVRTELDHRPLAD